MDDGLMMDGLYDGWIMKDGWTMDSMDNGWMDDGWMMWMVR